MNNLITEKILQSMHIIHDIYTRYNARNYRGIQVEQAFTNKIKLQKAECMRDLTISYFICDLKN